jgi:hypothetical protein
MFNRDRRDFDDDFDFSRNRDDYREEEREYVQFGYSLMKCGEKGFVIKLIDRSRKTHFTDKYKLWQRSRDGLTPMLQSVALSLIEEFKAEDSERKAMYGHLLKF